MILGMLGNAYASLGDFGQAIAYYEKALALFRDRGAREELRVRGNLGLAYLAMGDTQKAEVYLKGKTYDFLRPALYELAVGSYHEVIKILEPQLKSIAEARFPEALFGSYLALARAYEGLKRADEARKFYRLAVAMVEEEREGLTEDQREHFFGAKLHMNYTRLTPYEGLIRLGQPAEAFEHAEAMKARRMLEQAARREGGRDPGVSDSLRREEEEVVGEISALLTRRESAIKQNAKQEIEEAERALKAARQRRVSLIDRLYRDAPEYAAIRYPRPLKVEEVRLKPGEVLIEFA
jgi:tetratricopeptide (TPR) repeat protein